MVIWYIDVLLADVLFFSCIPFSCCKDAEVPLSPYYNWACGIDIKMEEHAQLVQESVSQNLNITQGIKLVKIWLAQRKLDKVSSIVYVFFSMFLLLLFFYV